MERKGAKLMDLQKITGIGTQYVDCCEQWVRYNVVLNSQGLPLVYLHTEQQAILNNKKLHKLVISEIINKLTEDLK
jgi:hypothetical protein